MPIRASAGLMEGESAVAVGIAADFALRRAMRRQARLVALALRAREAGLLLGTAEQPLLIESCGASDGGPEPPPEVLATSTRASEAENPAPTTCLGTPIRNGDGETVGLLWAISLEPRVWSRRERRLLDTIAAATADELDLRLAGASGDMPLSPEPEGGTLTTSALLRNRSDDRLLHALRDGILSAVHEGYAEAGTRLPSIREVADRIGTTRYSVLQAYRTLEGEGIVEKRHRSGVYVASLGEAPSPHLPETAGWLGRVITECYLHQVKLPALPTLIQRWTASTTIRCACVESSDDYRLALTEEIRTQFGLDAIGVPFPAPSDNGDGPPVPRAELERLLQPAHLVITTPFHAPEMGRLADRMGLPMIVATLDEESRSIPLRRLQEGHELVLICVDPAFGNRLLRSIPLALRPRVRVVTTDTTDAIDALDRTEPVLMTEAARARLTGADFRLLAARYPSFSRRFAERLAPIILQINLEHLRRGTATSRAN